MKGIVYDCEVICCVSPKNGELDILDSNYQYANGWTDYENLGISVIGVIYLDSEKTEVFVNSQWENLKFPNFSDFQQLIYNIQKNDGIIAGFNSISFDDRLCRANGIAIATNFDLLQEVRVAAYGSTEWSDQPEDYSYSLDAITRANGYCKTGHGASAAKQWQDKYYFEVIDYCINDCRITKRMIELFNRGELIDPNNGRILKPVSY